MGLSARSTINNSMRFYSQPKMTGTMGSLGQALKKEVGEEDKSEEEEKKKEEKE